LQGQHGRWLEFASDAAMPQRLKEYDNAYVVSWFILSESPAVGGFELVSVPLGSRFPGVSNSKTFLGL